MEFLRTALVVGAGVYLSLPNKHSIAEEEREGEGGGILLKDHSVGYGE